MCKEKLDEILAYMHQTSSRKKLEALEDRMEEAEDVVVKNTSHFMIIKHFFARKNII